MPDYFAKLKSDLVEQFKDAPIIEALLAAVARQMDDIARYFDQLRDLRSLQKADGAQLDGIGNIVCLTRKEAGEYYCNINNAAYVITDDKYRQYLIWKIWRNTNQCTYYDIMKGIGMFWPEPLLYSESPDNPAAITFTMPSIDTNKNLDDFLTMPIVKPAGVRANFDLHFNNLFDDLSGDLNDENFKIGVGLTFEESIYLGALCYRKPVFIGNRHNGINRRDGAISYDSHYTADISYGDPANPELYYDEGDVAKLYISYDLNTFKENYAEKTVYHNARARHNGAFRHSGTGNTDYDGGLSLRVERQGGATETIKL